MPEVAKVRIHQRLDEGLHAELKAEAARRRMPLYELIETYLRERLEEVYPLPAAPAPRTPHGASLLTERRPAYDVSGGEEEGR